jgi:hypothetical protein
MNSHSSPSEPRDTVHVVGGGLAGLTAAAIVARAGVPVIVHEQRNRLGGRATTDERNGYRFNQGPHALYLGGEGVPILERLGVVLAGSAPATKGGRMVVGGQSHLMPANVASLATTRVVGMRDKVDLGRLLARIGSIDTGALAATSVDDWVAATTDRPRAAAVIHALVRLSAYVNNPRQLSAEVGVLQLQRALGAGVRYLDGGWDRLVGQLAEIVTSHGGRIQRGDVLTELPDAAAVIVAGGGPEVAERLTGASFAVGPRAEATVLDLALSTAPEHRFVLGVDEAMYLSDHGFMVDMSPAGGASVSLGQYLAQPGEPGAEPDRDGLRAFAVHAGITDDIVVDERFLHRMTTVTAIATPGLGGLAGRPPVAVPDRDGVFVAGDWVGDRGHLADAVLASADEAANRAVAHVTRKVTV